jgi:hypothetical protein
MGFKKNVEYELKCVRNANGSSEMLLQFRLIPQEGGVTAAFETEHLLPSVECAVNFHA